MAIDQPQGQPLSARGELTLGLKVVLAVAGIIAAAMCWLLVLRPLILSCVLSNVHTGAAIDAERARQIVVEQSDALQRVLALTRRSPLPARDDPACRALATELGALDIRFESRREGAWVRIAYSRGGIPETYETQLTWVPAATAELVRTGRDRLGEHFEYIDQGWWWVFW